MGDLVNLRQRRKAEKRRQKAAKAAENRVRFGTPKAQRDRDRAETERAAQKHKGKKLD